MINGVVTLAQSLEEKIQSYETKISGNSKISDFEKKEAEVIYYALEALGSIKGFKGGSKWNNGVKGVYQPIEVNNGINIDAFIISQTLERLWNELHESEHLKESEISKIEKLCKLCMTEITSDFSTRNISDPSDLKIEMSKIFGILINSQRLMNKLDSYEQGRVAYIEETLNKLVDEQNPQEILKLKDEIQHIKLIRGGSGITIARLLENVLAVVEKQKPSIQSSAVTLPVKDVPLNVPIATSQQQQPTPTVQKSAASREKKLNQEIRNKINNDSSIKVMDGFINDANNYLLCAVSDKPEMLAKLKENAVCKILIQQRFGTMEDFEKRELEEIPIEPIIQDMVKEINALKFLREDIIMEIAPPQEYLNTTSELKIIKWEFLNNYIEKLKKAEENMKGKVNPHDPEVIEYNRLKEQFSQYKNDEDPWIRKFAIQVENGEKLNRNWIDRFETMQKRIEANKTKQNRDKIKQQHPQEAKAKKLVVYKPLPISNTLKGVLQSDSQIETLNKNPKYTDIATKLKLLKDLNELKNSFATHGDTVKFEDELKKLLGSGTTDIFDTAFDLQHELYVSICQFEIDHCDIDNETNNTIENILKSSKEVVATPPARPIIPPPPQQQITQNSSNQNKDKSKKERASDILGAIHHMVQKGVRKGSTKIQRGMDAVTSQFHSTNQRTTSTDTNKEQEVKDTSSNTKKNKRQ